MPAIRPRCRPTLDVLERRDLLSSVPVAGTFLTVPGDVSAPGAVAEVTAPIPASHVQRRHSTLFGVTVTPDPGSALQPAVISARGTAGEPLQLIPGGPFQPGVSSAANAFVRVGHPGPITLGVKGQHATTGPFHLGVDLPGDILNTGQISLADVKAYTVAYLSHQGDGFYNPAADANHNGQVGQHDGRLLLRNLAPLTRKAPLIVTLSLSPKDEAHTTAKTSGGITYHKTVTIFGRTTPGSLIFSDNGLANFAFNGPALTADANGYFSITVKMKDGINNFEFLVVDPYGQQTIRAFPILWLGFGQQGG